MIVVQMDLKQEEIVMEMIDWETSVFVVEQEISELYLWMFEELEE